MFQFRRAVIPLSSMVSLYAVQQLCSSLGRAHGTHTSLPAARHRLPPPGSAPTVGCSDSNLGAEAEGSPRVAAAIGAMFDGFAFPPPAPPGVFSAVQGSRACRAIPHHSPPAARTSQHHNVFSHPGCREAHLSGSNGPKAGAALRTQGRSPAVPAGRTAGWADLLSRHGEAVRRPHGSLQYWGGKG